MVAVLFLFVGGKPQQYDSGDSLNISAKELSNSTDNLRIEVQKLDSLVCDSRLFLP